MFGAIGISLIQVTQTRTLIQTHTTISLTGTTNEQIILGASTEQWYVTACGICGPYARPGAG